MKMTKATCDALTKEAISYGLNVKGKCDGCDALLTFLDMERSNQRVARRFAQKYRGHINIVDGCIRINADEMRHPHAEFDPKAILAFHDANIQLAIAEHNLNEASQPTLTRLHGKKDIDGLIGLADTLPLDYPGTRRVYECILRFQDEKR